MADPRTNGAAPAMLPPTWHTDQLAVADAQPADVDTVLQCLAESADIALLDPAFGPAPRNEIEALVAKSQRPDDGAGRDFQMQTFRLRGGAEPAGYWHVTRVPGRPTAVGVSILLVRPAHRRLGLGRQLIDAAAAHLASGHREFWARVYLKNTRAVEFWAGLGFERLVRHRGRFVLPPDDASSIVLAKDLPARSEPGR